MRRIFADFNNMTTEDRLELGTDEKLDERGEHLIDGEAVILHTPCDIEADGVTHFELTGPNGTRWWYAIVDLHSFRDVDADLLEPPPHAFNWVVTD